MRFSYVHRVIGAAWLLLACLLSAQPVAAYQSFTATLSFYEGLDLASGMTELDPTVLTILIGRAGEIQTISSPPAKPLCEFAPAIDLLIALTTNALQPYTIMAQPGVRLAKLPDMPFAAITETLLAALPYHTQPVMCDTDDLVAVVTADTAYFVLGHLTLLPNGTSVRFTYLADRAPGSVPEPSTMTLMGAGLIASILAKRFHRRRRLMSGMITLLGIFALPMMSAAAVVTMTAEGSGQGVILGPGIYCNQACTPTRCGDTCRQTFPENTVLHLKAKPDALSVFRGWLVNGTPHEGVIEIHADITITALFDSTLPPEHLALRYYWYETDGVSKQYVFLALDEIEFTMKKELADLWWAKTPEEQKKRIEAIRSLLAPDTEFDGVGHLKSPAPVTKEHLLNTLDLLQSFSEIEEARPVFYLDPDHRLGPLVPTRTMTVVFHDNATDEQILAIEQAYHLVREENEGSNPQEETYHYYQARTPIEAIEIANRLYESGQVRHAAPEWLFKLIPLSSRRDDLRSKEERPWHLRNEQSGQDIHIFENAHGDSVWDVFHVNGSGMVIAVIDNGLETTHDDLHVLENGSYDFIEYDSNPLQDACPCGDAEECQQKYQIPCDGEKVELLYAQKESSHGTSVAGLAAARGFNQKGILGAAPSASVVGFRVRREIPESRMRDEILAKAFLSHNERGRIYNFSMARNAAIALGKNEKTKDNLRIGATTQKNIYVAAAGNCECQEHEIFLPDDGFGTASEDCGDNAFKMCRGSNAYAIQNSRYIIPVAASTRTGTHDAFSEEGANILINAPGGTADILTTDYDNGYRDDFGNTSAATPLVSGVAALMLQANPNLTYRDVQQIFLTTAEKNPAWDGTPNAAGYDHSYQYGFGHVNAFEAVKTARTWKTLPDERDSGWKTPDQQNMIEVTASESLRIEYIEVEFSADMPYNSLNLTLISPTGKSQSVLAKQYGDPELYLKYKKWVFGTVRHFGEMSQGNWELEVTDHNGNKVTDYTWRLKIYGTELPPATWSLDSPKAVCAMSNGQHRVSCTLAKQQGEIALSLANGILTFADTPNAQSGGYQTPPGERAAWTLDIKLPAQPEWFVFPDVNETKTIWCLGSLFEDQNDPEALATETITRRVPWRMTALPDPTNNVCQLTITVGPAAPIVMRFQPAAICANLRDDAGKFTRSGTTSWTQIGEAFMYAEHNRRQTYTDVQISTYHDEKYHRDSRFDNRTPRPYEGAYTPTSPWPSEEPQTQYCDPYYEHVEPVYGPTCVGSDLKRIDVSCTRHEEVSPGQVYVFDTRGNPLGYQKQIAGTYTCTEIRNYQPADWVGKCTYQKTLDPASLTPLQTFTRTMDF